VSADRDRLLTARVTFALVVANVRYWSTVAPLVRAELRHWRGRAAAIPNPAFREIALAKLDGERFNAEAGAMLATLAPRAHRADAVRAIVALELLFDLLDGLTEQPLEDPLGDGERMFAPFTDALGPAAPQPPLDERANASPDLEAEGGYLLELSRAARDALARLPARDAVIEPAAAAAARAAQAQIRMHAVPRLGTGQLRQWGQAQAPAAGLEWRELLAGAASSVLVVHALIAAAADPGTTRGQATRIADTYLSVCVALTLLDSLVDEDQDERTGRPGYVSLYEDRELLALRLAETARRAAGQARELPGGAHHVAILLGVVAYYASSPGARGARAKPIFASLHRSLAPAIDPPLALMRAWRLARRLRVRLTSRHLQR
jgi:tetraprenyl-beta-curcumene synthase